MKMIDVLNMMAKGEIKDQTILDVYDHTGDIYTYTFDEEFKAFYDEYDNEMAGDFEISNKFLNYEVELIPPKEKKYLVKLTIRGINDENTYLNRNRKRNVIFLSDNFEGQYSQTKFTKQEMQDIQLVREFLEDIEGKYKLIEVE
ncbi:hypothetical protein V4S33_07260 [Enterococcus cecorum]